MTEPVSATPEKSTADARIATARPDFTAAELGLIADPRDRLQVIMQCLLGPGGCPWDREQTHRTLRQYTLEEAHEVAEAIDEGDDENLCEELGDLALQVVFHAEMARARGAFAWPDVYTAICDKLIRRHPHVFGDVDAADSAEVLRNWEQLKKAEKKDRATRTGDDTRASALAGVPRSLPALQRAARLQEKAARVGFDWDRAEDCAAKVREEVEEFLAESSAFYRLAGARDAGEGSGGSAEETTAANELSYERLEEEFGDLLFSLVNISRFLDLRAEEALQKGCNKFVARFAAIELAAERQGRELKSMTLAEMDALWDEAKREVTEK